MINRITLKKLRLNNFQPRSPGVFLFVGGWVDLDDEFYMKKYLKILLFSLMVFMGCEDEKDSNVENNNGDNGGSGTVYGCTDPDATNYNSEATVDDGSCEYSPANVIGSETGMSYNQGSESASMSYRLNNTGGTTAYNVQYRLRIQYKCITGFAGQGWTSEILPSSSSLYTYGDIPAGYDVDFTDNVGLCSGLGIDQFTFEVYQVVWD